LLLFVFVYRTVSVLASLLLTQHVIKEELNGIIVVFSYVYEVCSVIVNNV
jgi:hypothetical protein